MLAAKALHGFDLNEQQQLFLTSDFSSRFEDGHARNLIADAGAKYYWRWRRIGCCMRPSPERSPPSLDPDMQLLLGGDNGLRGYPLRYESGTSRALFTVEQRVFTDWFPFRLVRVGGAVFADVGRTWGTGVIGNSDPGLLQGRGLRTAPGQYAHGSRQRAAHRFRFSAQRCRRNPEIPIPGADHAKLLGCWILSVLYGLAAPREKPQKTDPHTAKFSTHHHSCRLLFLSSDWSRAAIQFATCL
jgi:hypothetical protein